MKIAELLRALSDIVASADTEAPAGQETPAQTPAVDPHGDAEVGIMVPPLQQKLELLKKSAGVDNMYDNQDGQETDELVRIKQLGGVTPTAQHLASDDHEAE